MIYFDEGFMTEDDRLEYSIILAEYEFQNDLLGLYKSTILQESGLVYIEESIKETIVRYLNKIVTSLQKSWETFLANFQEGLIKKDVERLKGLELSDAQLGTIVVDNFPIYDDNKINGIKVIPFTDYQAMKQFLKDDKTFIGKYYPNIAPKEGEKLKDTMFKYCLSERKDQFRMTKQDMQNVTDYLVSYKDKLDTITNDLKQINDSCKNINTLVNNSTETNDNVANTNDVEEVKTATATSTVKANTGGANIPNGQTVEGESAIFNSLEDVTSLLESILLEADPPVKANPEPATGAAAGSMVTNANKEKEKQNDQDVKVKSDKVTKADKNSQIVKDVQVYMSASTKVLVAKMRLLRIRCRNYQKIMKAVLDKFDPKNKKNQEKKEAPASEELKQINI